ncbi:MAG: rod shape-determining protein MreC [Spirochaetales bacterium]|nr:rod shape-determining protein MreC [Spirochaetales bacterium]
MKKNSIHFRFSEFILALFLIISGVMLGFSSGKFVVNFNSVGFTVFSSMQKGVSYVADFFTGTVTAVKEMAELKKEYEILSKKLADYEYLERSVSEVKKENERLKELLDYSQSIQYKSISAQIIGRDPDGLYSGITLNKGAKHGIKKGMSVMAIQKGNSGIVGKVVTVGAFTSLIMPVYDTHCYISARIQNSRDIGIISGQGAKSSKLDLSYIRKSIESEIQTGDIIVTSGESDNYLKDIPIGRISKVSKIDYESSLLIEVDPIIDFARLENVIVIDNTQINKDYVAE